MYLKWSKCFGYKIQNFLLEISSRQYDAFTLSKPKRSNTPSTCVGNQLIFALLVRYSTTLFPGACLSCNQLSATDLFWRIPYCRLPQHFVWCVQLQQNVVCVRATWNSVHKTKKCKFIYVYVKFYLCSYLNVTCNKNIPIIVVTFNKTCSSQPGPGGRSLVHTQKKDLLLM